MSHIRVTYSGLVALVIGLTSVVTGMIFTLIVTRKLSPEEFGLWSVIGSMISYFLVTEPIISFWSTRQIARGEEIGKTSLISSLMFSIGSIPIYIVLSFFVSQASHQNFNSLLFATMLLPVTFVSQTLSGINLGHKPHANSYGLLAFESLKIPTGLVLVYYLNLGIEGAILTTSIAYVLKIIVQFYFVRERIKSALNFTTLKKWIKLSWVPLYSNLGHIASILDVVLFSIITSSVVGVAYYSISNTIAAIIANAGLISQAVYPKLLSKVGKSHAQENFTQLMYFAIPLLGITLVFSKPALFALNPAYVNGSIVVIIIAFRTFFYVITSVLYQNLMGVETIDVQENPRFMEMLKSKIFFIPSLQNLQYSMHVITVVVIISTLHSSGMSEIELVKWWSMIGLVIQIPFLVYAWIMTRKHVGMSLPITSIFKYSLSTLAFMIVFLLTSKQIITYQKSIYEFLPNVILELGICMSVYLLITVLIDTKTRILFKSIIYEIKKNR